VWALEREPLLRHFTGEDLAKEFSFGARASSPWNNKCIAFTIVLFFVFIAVCAIFYHRKELMDIVNHDFDGKSNTDFKFNFKSWFD
jgi:hypothetical protein